MTNQNETRRDYVAIAGACGWKTCDGMWPAKATHSSYWLELHNLVRGDAENFDWTDLKAVGHATAPQRCEALLRTLGKWIETKPRTESSEDFYQHGPGNHYCESEGQDG